MPKLIKSDALILKRIRHGDTSLIVHAFTRDFGRVPFIAKGARSGGKKPPVPLIPVVVLEFVWSPSTRSELQLLREWSLVDGFGAIHRDYVKLAWAQAAVEVLARTLSGEEEHERLFEITLAYLRALGDTSDRFENLFILFRLHALRELGYELSLSIREDERGAVFYVPGRGIVPGTPSGRAPAGGIRIQPGTWKSLGALAKHGFSGAGRFRLQKNARAEVERVLDAAYRHAFDRWGKLESLKLLAPMEAFAGQGSRGPSQRPGEKAGGRS
ncbi:MAG: DNA repair protein RecO [Calditrichaeota bacterium]|nr:DNA repair protein RecO [Calditrichota bacterium]